MVFDSAFRLPVLVFRVDPDWCAVSLRTRTTKIGTSRAEAFAGLKMLLVDEIEAALGTDPKLLALVGDTVDPFTFRYWVMASVGVGPKYFFAETYVHQYDSGNG